MELEGHIPYLQTLVHSGMVHLNWFNRRMECW